MATKYEYYITGDDGYEELYGSDIWQAQTFTPSTAHTITSVKLLLAKIGSTPGTITVSIKATSGNHPTGDDLCSGTTNGNTLTTDEDTGEWREITFSSGYALTASTKYAIIVKALDGSSSHKIRWRRDSSASAYSGGNREYTSDAGSSWSSDLASDFMFEDWGSKINTVSASVSLGLSPLGSYTKAHKRSASVSLGLSPSVSYGKGHERSASVSLGMSPSCVIDATFKYTITASSPLGTSLSVSRAITTSRSSSASMSLVPSGESSAKNIGAFLCVASKDSGSVKTHNALGASWTDCAKDAGGGLYGSYFAQYLNRLCVINYQNAGFSYSSGNDITANWTEKASFPNYPQKFTDLFVGRDAGDDPALYFLTPVGMYYLDVFTNFVAGPTEVTWEYDSTSGKVGFYGRGGHYIAVGKGIYNINKGVVTLIGPDMDDGLPETLQGTISDMIQVGFWLVIAIDGGSSNKSSIMKRYITGNHWHSVYVGSVNTPIRALFWDSGTLYFGEGTNVKSLPFSNKTENVAKLSTHTYCASGDLIYPYFHSEFEAMPKVAHKVRAVTQDCDSDDYLTIYYRTDETTTWTELGTLKTSPRPTALAFPTSGDSIGVSFERIQFKSSFARGSTTTNSPKLESLTLEYRVVPPVLWGWDFRVQAVSSGDRSGQEIISALKTALETGTLLSFYPDGDKSGTEYFVEVSNMPGNEAGTEFGQEGIYTVSVQEVID